MQLLALMGLGVLVACGTPELGREANAQSVGPGALRQIVTDNMTLEGAGTVSNSVRLKAVQTDGSTVMGTGSAGSPLTLPWAAEGSHIFCDGSDGDATISVDTDMTRDTCYEDLVIDGAILNAVGRRVFASGTITFLNGGSIRFNGGNASGSTAGTGAVGSNLGGGAAGGNGGTTGMGNSSSNSGGVGVQGCVNTGGEPGWISNPPGGTGSACSGGGGGYGTGGQGYVGGGMPPNGATNGDYRMFQFAIDGNPNSGNTSAYKGGAGGGGGGGSATGNGGGGGGGAGYLVVATRQFIATSCHANGCLQARGGDGGNAAGNGGGGGGGGGGVIVCVRGTGSCPALSVSGGAGGLGSGSGAAGGPGGSGFSVSFLIGR